jgi:hypothetical protein
MKRLPHASGVSKAIRGVRSATKKALKGLNQLAGQRMSRGDYATAEALAGKGRDVRQFQQEVDALFKRWREVASVGAAGPKSEVTPLWTYYQPILQALVAADGECRRTELEATLERSLEGQLQPGDQRPLSSGRERWRVMVRRARKPLIGEGWIEPKSGKVWRITEAGRKAAERSDLGGRRS